MMVAIISNATSMRWGVFYLVILFFIPLPIVYYGVDMKIGMKQAGRYRMRKRNDIHMANISMTLSQLPSISNEFGRTSVSNEIMNSNSNDKNKNMNKNNIEMFDKQTAHNTRANSRASLDPQAIKIAIGLAGNGATGIENDAKHLKLDPNAYHQHLSVSVGNVAIGAGFASDTDIDSDAPPTAAITPLTTNSASNSTLNSPKHSVNLNAIELNIPDQRLNASQTNRKETNEENENSDEKKISNAKKIAHSKSNETKLDATNKNKKDNED